MIAGLHVLFHMAMLLSLTFLVLLLPGLVLWTPASNGTIIQGERRTEIETETETENEIGTGTENVNAHARESGSGIIAQHLVFSTVMKNATDIGSMRKEAMSVTEQVEKKKNDIEKDDTERKRKQDTSHLEVIVEDVMKVRKETVTGDTSTKNLKEAKKEKKLAVSLPLSRRAPKLHQLSSLGTHIWEYQCQKQMLSFLLLFFWIMFKKFTFNLVLLVCKVSLPALEK